MRSAKINPVTTLGLAVVGLGLLALAGCAQRAPGASGTQPTTRTPGVVKEFPDVLGRGRDQQEAEADAVKKAEVMLENFLHGLNPPLEWVPPPGFVRLSLFKGEPVRVEEEDQTVEGFRVKCWKWTLALTAEDWDRIFNLDRQARAERRMVHLGQFLAGIVALLAVVTGYIRLDEYTKGYYTGWLRLGAVSLLAAAGTGLWWLS